MKNRKTSELVLELSGDILPDPENYITVPAAARSTENHLKFIAELIGPARVEDGRRLFNADMAYLLQAARTSAEAAFCAVHLTFHHFGVESDLSEGDKEMLRQTGINQNLTLRTAFLHRLRATSFAMNFSPNSQKESE